MPVRNLADIERIEAEPLIARSLPRATYEVFTAGAMRWRSSGASAAPACWSTGWAPPRPG